MIWKIGAVLLVSLAASEGSPVEGPLCACPFVNHPVCGSDGVTYDNDCMLRCLNPSATVEYRGACGHKEVPCFCTADYAPVCGTNDRTYSNECSLNCDKGGIHSIPNLALKHTGVCRDKRNTEQCACPFIIRPVCGSDGVTYDNDCMLRCMNPGATIEYRGSCGHKEVPCICTEKYAPVCGTNDRTYPNECSLNCDKHGPHSFPNLALKHHGVCKTKRSVDLTDCICPLRILHELCGTDGETYANDCYFDCAKGKQTGLKVQHEGRCNAKRSSDPKECACPAIRFPVCGTDGHTYPNDCMLKCSNPEAEVRHHGECNKNEGKTKRSVDVADLCQCTLDLDPVCGTDGKTYGNKCALNCTKHRNNQTALAVKHEGECKSKPDPCTCTFELDEQCGSDGNTYPNPCVLECQRKKRPELELRHSGVCKEVSKRSVETVKVALPSCLCVQRNKHEVCGTDGVSYVNDCFFDCAKRRQPALEVSHEGRCVEKVSVVEIAQGLRDPCFCVQKILHEICGTDGVTYANDCFFECAKSKQSTLEIAHEGRCEKVAVVEG